MKPDIVPTTAVEWRAFADAPGVRYKVLRHHADRRGITVLDGAHEYGAHTYVYQPPGSVHRPASRTGCTLLVTLPAHIERLDV
jgi:hypothetical protein